ncbi:hypothetical protein [Promicromonospora sp. AC04]|uniref:hypothetical protein n=1 Tax=Promicromonospora sp. AC04 TaxID=2135723 RepID=UPI0011B1D403|nr:hypothetical protein [Promicromonospora sp. AC04]
MSRPVHDDQEEGGEGSAPDGESSQTEGLGRFSRIVAGVVAAAGLVAGGVAVYVNSSEAGSVALVLVGGVFAYLALSGQALRRLKLGENEAEFSNAVKRAAMRRVKSGDAQFEASGSAADVATEILEEAAQDSSNVPQEVLAITSAHRYERAVLAALRRVAQSMDAQDGLIDSGFDAVVNGKIAVQIKFTQSRAIVVDSARRLVGLADWQTVLYVSNRPIIFTNRRERAPEVDERVRTKVVRWTPDMGDGPLAQALSDIT